jgi:hypothetical protein
MPKPVTNEQLVKNLKKSCKQLAEIVERLSIYEVKRLKNGRVVLIELEDPEDVASHG